MDRSLALIMPILDMVITDTSDDGSVTLDDLRDDLNSYDRVTDCVGILGDL